MLNKEKLKTSIEKDFNKQKNYNEIIKRIEGGNKMKRILEYSTAICLIGIICVYAFFYKENTLDNKIDKQDKITINKMKMDNYEMVDIDGKAEDINIDEIYNIYPNLKSIVLPSDLKLARTIKMYSRQTLEDDYTVFDGYNIMYVNGTSGTENTKDVEIFISKTLKEKRRAISVLDNSYKSSSINGISLTITSYGDTFIANFKYNDVYFDIETKNFTQDELLKLLESIIDNK